MKDTLKTTIGYHILLNYLNHGESVFLEEQFKKMTKNDDDDILDEALNDLERHGLITKINDTSWEILVSIPEIRKIIANENDAGSLEQVDYTYASGHTLTKQDLTNSPWRLPEKKESPFRFHYLQSEVERERQKEEDEEEDSHSTLYNSMLQLGDLGKQREKDRNDMSWSEGLIESIKEYIKKLGTGDAEKMIFTPKVPVFFPDGSPLVINFFKDEDGDYSFGDSEGLYRYLSTLPNVDAHDLLTKFSRDGDLLYDFYPHCISAVVTSADTEYRLDEKVGSLITDIFHVLKSVNVSPARSVNMRIKSKIITLLSKEYACKDEKDPSFEDFVSETKYEIIRTDPSVTPEIAFYVLSSILERADELSISPMKLKVLERCMEDFQNGTENEFHFLWDLVWT